MMKRLASKLPSIPSSLQPSERSNTVNNSSVDNAGGTSPTSVLKNMVSKFPSVPSEDPGQQNSSTSLPSSTSSSSYSTPDISKYINSASASAAASSVFGMMKKAQSAASVMLKEGTVKAAEMKKKAVAAADMDALQRRLESALDPDGESTRDATNLSYITDRIIAMGFPGNSSSTPLRTNPMDSIASFLNEKHQGHYMIWNLSEEPYDYSKLTDQVLEFKFPGHPAPPLGLLIKICTSIESWLNADPDNVAVIHCLTGKGRTGTVISCFLAWTVEFPSPMEALQFVSQKRQTSIEKMTIPSQRRYLHYFANLMDGVKPRSSPLLLRRVIINSIPVFAVRTTNEVNEEGELVTVEAKGCCPYIQIFKNGKLVFTTTWKDAEKGDGVKWASVNDGSTSFSIDCMLQGDILIRCRHLSDNGERISMFRAAFHTGYIPLGILRLTKAQLDGACQDERYEQDFFVDLIFAPVQSDLQGQKEGIAPGAQRTEGIAISSEDQQAYDILLENDERFWQDIASKKEQNLRKKSSAKQKNGYKKLTLEQQQQGISPTKRQSLNMFSIFGADDEHVHLDTTNLSPHQENWDPAEDEDFMAHIESLTNETDQEKKEICSLSSSHDSISSVNTLSNEEKVTNSEEDNTLDAELAELSKLEEELGIEAFSSNKTEMSLSKTIETQNSSSSSALSNGQSSNATETETSSSIAALDVGNDNFDELEEYLNTLSSGNK